MAKRCCITKCNIAYFSGVSFHSFPVNEELKKKWLDAVHVAQKITRDSVVCSLHFRSSDFHKDTSRQTLKDNVVPSIFPVTCRVELKPLSTEATLLATEQPGVVVPIPKIDPDPNSVRTRIKFESDLIKSKVNLKSENTLSSAEDTHQPCEDLIQPSNAQVSLRSTPALPRNAPVSQPNAPASLPVSRVSLSKAPVSPHKAPISLSNAPVSLNNAPVSLRNARVSLSDSPVSRSNAPISPRNAPVLLRNARVSLSNTPVSQRKSPVSPRISSVSLRNARVSQSNAPVSPPEGQVSPPDTHVLPPDAHVSPPGAHVSPHDSPDPLNDTVRKEKDSAALTRKQAKEITQLTALLSQRDKTIRELRLEINDLMNYISDRTWEARTKVDAELPANSKLDMKQNRRLIFVKREWSPDNDQATSETQTSTVGDKETSDILQTSSLDVQNTSNNRQESSVGIKRTLDSQESRPSISQAGRMSNKKRRHSVYQARRSS